MTFLAWALIFAPCLTTTVPPPGVTEPGFSWQLRPAPESGPARVPKSNEVGIGTGSGPAPGVKEPSWVLIVAAAPASCVNTPFSGVAAASAPGTLLSTRLTGLCSVKIRLGSRPVALKSSVVMSGVPGGTGRLAVSTSGRFSREIVAGTWKLLRGAGSGVLHV